MEQNMLREDQALLPIGGLAVHRQLNQVTSTKRFIRGVTVFINIEFSRQQQLNCTPKHACGLHVKKE